MPRPFVLLTLIWVPFLSIFLFASPAVVDRWGDSYPHIAFHVASLGSLMTAFVLLRRLRPSTVTRVQRFTSGLLLFLLPLAMLGNLAELVTAVARLADDGWESVLTPDMFETGPHAGAAALTIPALMLSMLAVTVLSAASALQRSGKGELDRV